MAIYRPKYRDPRTGKLVESDICWFEFEFKGERIRQSTHTANERAARQIEAAHRLRLAKGEAGIHERPPAPTLADFAPRFESAIMTLCAEKPATVDFYKKEMRRLLKDRPLAGARLIRARSRVATMGCEQQMEAAGGKEQPRPAPERRFPRNVGSDNLQLPQFRNCFYARVIYSIYGLVPAPASKQCQHPRASITYRWRKRRTRQQ